MHPPGDESTLKSAHWVPETQVGAWFQRTSIWRDYVLTPGVEAMRSVLQAGSSGTYDRILDAGCGDGVAFELLNAHFKPKEIIAVDIDSKAIQRAQAAALPYRNIVDVRLGDVTQLALDDNSIDMVFCHQTLHE